MNRPKVLHVGGVLYWVMRIRNPDTQVLKDADSTPTVAIRKNGSSTGDSVTVTKRSATTGIYDCSYNPAGEVEGDEFTVEETATVTGTTTVQATYSTSWEFTVIAVERGTDGANTTAPANSTIADISSRLPAALDGGRIAAVLDSATQTQLDNIESIAAQRAFGIIERPPADTGVITFAWPALGATITGTVSLNNASYIPVTGAFAFLRTDGGKYFYTLAYNAADRPATAGSARYALTDGTYTRYLVLRVVESGDTGETTALAVLCFDWEAITGEVPSRSVLNALRHIRNKWALDGATKTVYAEDDTTPAYTTTVTADGAGNITADTPD